MKTQVDWEDYLGEEVVDRRGDPIGRLECYWTGEDDVPAFIGISTEEDRNHTFVVPAALSRREERYSCIRLTIPGIKVRQAPQLECDQPIDTAFARRLAEFFHLEPAQTPHDFHIHKG
jgi:hypothetical protein